jgi:hypothetical protein
MQSIFDVAVQHSWRSMAGTCYLSVGSFALSPQARGTRLLMQIDALSKIASGGDVDPETIARARAAIEREMMGLAPSSRRDAEVPPDVAQAAHILTELLLQD